MEETKRLLISDINSDTNLTISATLDGKKLDIAAEYVQLAEQEMEEIKKAFGDKVLPLEKIVQERDENIFKISFKGNVSQMELLAVNSTGVYIWSNVKIYKVKLTTGRVVQILVVKSIEGKRFNRRRGVRISLDRNMEIEQDGQVFKALVRDLSYCGVGLIEPLGTNLQMGMPFTLHLTEEYKDGEKPVAKIVGKVLRQTTNESGGVISGCVISANHAAFLQRYIAIKQVEKLSGKKQDVSLQKTATGDDWKQKIVDALDAPETPKEDSE